MEPTSNLPPHSEMSSKGRDVAQMHRRILISAREVFARRGISAGLNEIALHAGIGVGTVYRHFPRKRDLIDATLQDEFDAIVLRVEQLMTTPNAWEALTTVLREAVALTVENRGLRDLAFTSPRGRDAVERGHSALEPILERLVQAAREDGALRPDIVVDDLVMIMLMVSEFAYRSESTREGAYHRYLDLLIDGIRNMPSARSSIHEPLNHDEALAVAQGWT